MCRLGLYAIILLTFSVKIVAQNIIDLPKINDLIALDGNLEEDAWNTAFEFNNFKQVEPNLGANAEEEVFVKVMYDEQFLYLGAKCFYKNPAQIFATTLERDAPQLKDDYIEIHIDTYNDKINTLVFRTNPLSARQDFEVSRDIENINLSWNTFWNAQSKIHQDGWSTEMKIPFSSLRYPKGTAIQMRMKAIVKYKMKNELLIAPLNNASVSSVAYHFDNLQEVRFEDLPSNKPLYITPYMKANVIHQNLLNTDENKFENQTQYLERKHYANSSSLDKVLSNLGLDIKYKPNTNHTIDFTLNTDFAEVEADDRIVNISRFPIFLTEKRLFFLENTDLFNSDQFDHRLFHSRRIGIQNGAAIPILGGIRGTGSSSTWQYGLLSMQTHQVENTSLSENMSVLRLRRNIGKLGSNIGFINTNKINGEDNNHLVAFDANLRFSDVIRTNFTLGTTFDQQTGNWKSMYGGAINTFKANGFGINYRFREYTEDFNPELGFLSRPNTKRLTLNNGWRKTYENPSFLSYLTLGNYITKYWLSSTGQHEFFQTNIYLTAIHKKGARFTMFFPMYQQDHLYEDWNIANGITIPASKYIMWKVNPIFITGRTKAYQALIDLEVGEFYGGKQFTIFYKINYDFNQFFTAELGGTYNRLSFPESYTNMTSGKINLSRYFTRLKVNFSAKMFLNTYFQYDTRANKMGLNLRFRYNPTEGTDLYLVYNHNANTERYLVSPHLPFTDNQVFVFKFSRTFIR